MLKMKKKGKDKNVQIRKLQGSVSETTKVKSNGECLKNITPKARP